MKLFANKKECKACSCNGAYTKENLLHAEKAKEESGIKILGSGCAKCIALEKAVKQAMLELDVNIDIQHITDFAQIASYGVMTTPALVIDGKVVSYGKVPTVGEIKMLIKGKG